MNFPYFVILGLAMALPLSAGPFQFKNEAEKTEWQKNVRSILDGMNERTKEEAILKLSEIVYKTNRQVKGPETDEFRREATEMLIAIPGHAKYYQDRIDALRKAVEAKQVASIVYFDAQNDLSVLQYLPDPETVKVLGELTGDTFGRDLTRPASAPDLYVEGGGPTTAQTAAVYLGEIGIANGPRIQKGLTEWQVVDLWKDWWGEIAGSKRTYRFEGSPVEYGPDGPAAAQTLERIAKTRKRDTERAGGHRKPSSAATAAQTIAGESSKFLPVAAAIAALALCAAAIWYFLKARKSH